MPSVPSERIAKGSVLRKVDNAVNARNAAGAFDRRAELLNLLHAIQPANEDQTQRYLEFLADHVPGMTADEIRYLREFYFTRDARSLWQHPRPSRPIEPVVRLGLIKAIEEAQANNLPLDSYWIAAAPADSQRADQETEATFETIIIRSPHQVTRLIYTPHPTAPAGYAPLRNDAPIFLCKQSEQNVVMRDLLSPNS
jgi:hypothetical protein